MNTTKRVIKAIENSIKKWERILADDRAIDKGVHNCPLCKLFWQFRCKDCPVYIDTRGKGCLATPYLKWQVHQEQTHPDTEKRIQCPACNQFAIKELEYLRDLKKQL